MAKNKEQKPKYVWRYVHTATGAPSMAFAIGTLAVVDRLASWFEAHRPSCVVQFQAARGALAGGPWTTRQVTSRCECEICKALAASVTATE